MYYLAGIALALLCNILMASDRAYYDPNAQYPLAPIQQLAQYQTVQALYQDPSGQFRPLMLQVPVQPFTQVPAAAYPMQQQYYNPMLEAYYAQQQQQQYYYQQQYGQQLPVHNYTQNMHRQNFRSGSNSYPKKKIYQPVVPPQIMQSEQPVIPQIQENAPVVDNSSNSALTVSDATVSIDTSERSSQSTETTVSTLQISTDQSSLISSVSIDTRPVTPVIESPQPVHQSVPAAPETSSGDTAIKKSAAAEQQPSVESPLVETTAPLIDAPPAYGVIKVVKSQEQKKAPQAPAAQEKKRSPKKKEPLLKSGLVIAPSEQISSPQNIQAQQPSRSARRKKKPHDDEIYFESTPVVSAPASIPSLSVEPVQSEPEQTAVSSVLDMPDKEKKKEKKRTPYQEWSADWENKTNEIFPVYRDLNNVPTQKSQRQREEQVIDYLKTRMGEGALTDEQKARAALMLAAIYDPLHERRSASLAKNPKLALTYYKRAKALSHQIDADWQRKLPEATFLLEYITADNPEDAEAYLIEKGMINFPPEVSLIYAIDQLKEKKYHNAEVAAFHWNIDGSLSNPYLQQLFIERMAGWSVADTKALMEHIDQTPPEIGGKIRACQPLFTLAKSTHQLEKDGVIKPGQFRLHDVLSNEALIYHLAAGYFFAPACAYAATLKDSTVAQDEQSLLDSVNILMIDSAFDGSLLRDEQQRQLVGCLDNYFKKGSYIAFQVKARLARDANKLPQFIRENRDVIRSLKFDMGTIFHNLTPVGFYESITKEADLADEAWLINCYSDLRMFQYCRWNKSLADRAIAVANEYLSDGRLPDHVADFYHALLAWNYYYHKDDKVSYEYHFNQLKDGTELKDYFILNFKGNELSRSAFDTLVDRLSATEYRPHAQTLAIARYIEDDARDDAMTLLKRAKADRSFWFDNITSKNLEALWNSLEEKMDNERLQTPIQSLIITASGTIRGNNYAATVSLLKSMYQKDSKAFLRLLCLPDNSYKKYCVMKKLLAANQSPAIAKGLQEIEQCEKKSLGEYALNQEAIMAERAEIERYISVLEKLVNSYDRRELADYKAAMEEVQDYAGNRNRVSDASITSFDPAIYNALKNATTVFVGGKISAMCSRFKINLLKN